MSRAVSRVPSSSLRLSALALALAATLALAPCAEAGEPPVRDISGEWTFAFTNDSDGSSYADPCTITQDGARFTGVITYMDGGRQTIESFEGRIAPDGSVAFTLYDQDDPVRHLGRISADGRTIAGTWSMEEGSGTFTLTRGPGADAPRPNLTGAWILAATGGPDARPQTDPCTLTQNGARLWGTVLRQRKGRTVPVPLEGAVADDGEVEFTLGEAAAPQRHQGRIAPDGGSVSGTWTDGTAQGDFHLTRTPLQQVPGPDTGNAPDDDTLAGPEAGPPPPDLSGTWTLTVTAPSGAGFSAPCAVTQEGGRLRGAARRETGAEVDEEALAGRVDTAGDVTFTRWDHGRPVKHRGHLADDGLRLEGNWTDDGATGPFTMVRDGADAAGRTQAAASRRPDLSGDWVLSFAQDPPGDAAGTGPAKAGPTFSDACTLRSDGPGRFSGEVSYFRNGKRVSEAVRGIIAADGTVHFLLDDAGCAVEHSGRLDPDTGAVIGRWSRPGRSGSFTLTRQ